MTTAFDHRLLCCKLRSIEFPANDTCRLTLPPMNCTDMDGSIRVASAVTRHLLDFELLRIETVSVGDQGRTTIYVRENKRAPWQARRIT